MKVYAVVYHDYDEHTTKYVCSCPSIAYSISGKLNRYLKALNPNGDNRPIYMVEEFDVIDTYVEPEYPQYALVGVKYEPEGKNDIERYEIFPIDSMDRWYFKSDTLPEWSKDVSVEISQYFSDAGSEDNLIEFSLHVPITKDDNVDTIRFKTIQVITNTVGELKAKGYELDKLLRCSVSELNPCIWNIRDYDVDLKIATIHIPNPLMQDVHIE